MKSRDNDSDDDVRISDDNALAPVSCRLTVPEIDEDFLRMVFEDQKDDTRRTGLDW